MISLENYFLVVLALVWIIAAVVQDLRKREVANWVNFSLIAIALSYRAFVSVWVLDYWYLVYGLIGFGIFFALANAFYYGRVFAGGDAKLLMALGAVLPFSSSLFENLENFLYFIVFLMFAGSLWGLVYSLVLISKHKRQFSKEFSKQLHKNKTLVKVFIIMAVLVFIFILFVKQYIFSLFSLLVLLFPFLYVYAKSIEESCMIKSVRTQDLTIGDWLYKPVKIGKRTIKPNWEGLNEDELKLLKKTKRKVLVKEGVPFTPSFLIAFIVLIWMLNNNLLNFI